LRFDPLRREEEEEGEGGGGGGGGETVDDLFPSLPPHFGAFVPAGDPALTATPQSFRQLCLRKTL